MQLKFNVICLNSIKVNDRYYNLQIVVTTYNYKFEEQNITIIINLTTYHF